MATPRSYHSPVSRFLSLFLMLACAIALPAAAGRLGNWSYKFQPMGLYPSYGATAVRCMTAWGSKLVVGGWFAEAGGLEASYIAVWNGQYWEALDLGLGCEPYALYDHGSLLVGGAFHEVDGEPMDYIARWDPSDQDWHSMGAIGGEVRAFCEHFGGLYAGGSFLTGDPYLPFSSLAHWNGIDWEYIPWFHLGTGTLHAMEHFWGAIYFGGAFQAHGALSLLGCDLEYAIPHNLDGHVYCLERRENHLFVGGIFQNADGVESHGLAMLWAGGGFLACPDPLEDRHVCGLASYGDDLFVATNHEVRQYYPSSWSEPLGGTFDGQLFCLETVHDAGGLFAAGAIPNGVARWDDGEWVHLGGGHSPSSRINCLAPFDGAVVAGGRDFSVLGIMEGYDECHNIARWDGDAWHRLVNGLGGEVLSLAVYQDDLYVGGGFTEAGDQPIQRIARWNGEAWHDLGGANYQVDALYVHQDELIAGGYFTSIGGVAAQRIARWDGAQWRTTGAGMDTGVWALTTYQEHLIAAGQFTTAGETAAAHIARWDGDAWHPLGEGLDGDVRSLTVWQGDLIAGGRFENAGGAPAANIARWDGAAWHPLGEGVGGVELTRGVTALQGTTTDLFVGGDFTTAQGEVARGVAVWDGATWSELGGGVRDGHSATRVNDFLVQHGNLYLGGDFARAGSAPSSKLALWLDGTITPTLIQSFVAREIDTGGEQRSIEVSWHTSIPVEPTRFRLQARTTEHTWTPRIIPQVAGGFLASDDSPHLIAADEVSYALEHRGESGSWQTVARQSIQLSPPAATRIVAVLPNPFNPRTEATFILDRPGNVRLEVFALDGRKVATLATSTFPAGRYSRVWDGRDVNGRDVATGTYVIRLKTDGRVDSVKVMLLR